MCVLRLQTKLAEAKDAVHQAQDRERATSQKYGDSVSSASQDLSILQAEVAKLRSERQASEALADMRQAGQREAEERLKVATVDHSADQERWRATEAGINHDRGTLARQRDAAREEILRLVKDLKVFEERERLRSHGVSLREVPRPKARLSRIKASLAGRVRPEN